MKGSNVKEDDSPTGRKNRHRDRETRSLIIVFWLLTHCHRIGYRIYINKRLNES